MSFPRQFPASPEQQRTPCGGNWLGVHPRRPFLFKQEPTEFLAQIRSADWPFCGRSRAGAAHQGIDEPRGWPRAKSLPPEILEFFKANDVRHGRPPEKNPTAGGVQNDGTVIRDGGKTVRAGRTP